MNTQPLHKEAERRLDALARPAKSLPDLSGGIATRVPGRTWKAVLRQMAAFALIGLPLAAQDADSRVWTNREGRAVKARFIELSGAEVVLELENGSRSKVALSTLSDPDQIYLRTQHGAPDSAVGGPPAGGTPVAGAPLLPQGSLAWPGAITLNPKVLTVQEGQQNAAARQYHYQTGGFGFICNAPLANSVLQGVALDFELARAALLQMPWGWQPRPKEGTLFKVYLTETLEDYVALGGDDRSGADAKDDYIFIKFSTLGLKKVGPRYAYDSKQNDSKNVVSMTTRLMFGEMGSLMDPWLRSGLEQLMGRLAFHKGTMRFQGLTSDLKEFMNHYASSYKIRPDVKRMLAYLREGSVSRERSTLQARHERQFDAVMLVYYFGFLEGDGSGARLHQFLREAAQEGLAWRAWRDTNGGTPRPRDSSQRSFNEMARENTDKFLQGRQDAQLAADIVSKYQGIGIKF